MNKKQTIRLNESQFNNLVEKVVKESVKQMLNEVAPTKSNIIDHDISQDIVKLLKKCEDLQREASNEGDDLKVKCAGILRDQLKKAMDDYYDGIYGYYDDQIKHNFTLP